MGFYGLTLLGKGEKQLIVQYRFPEINPIGVQLVAYYRFPWINFIGGQRGRCHHKFATINPLSETQRRCDIDL